MKTVLAALLLSLGIACKSGNPNQPAAGKGYVVVSRENPAYFQFSDGSPYVPVGLNMISPGSKYRNNPDSALWEMGQWMKKLSDNGGNYIRIWLSSPFWDIEDEKAGQYSVEKATRIDKLLEMASKYNIRVKMTFEHFRSLTMEENPQSWAVKSVYHTSNGGPLDNIRQYIATEKGRTSKDR